MQNIMSNFLFPLERYKYMQIKNMRILLAMLKDDARKQNKIRINCFQLVTKKKYGYIKRIIAQCKYCNAKLQYKGIKTEIQHFKDQHSNTQPYGESSTPVQEEKIVEITYRLVQFSNMHNHNSEITQSEQIKRTSSLKNEMILDHYQTLLRESAHPNYIKSQLKTKFHISDREAYKLLHPFQTTQRLYNISKQKMRNLNYTIIEKFSDMIDVSKVKSNYSSYIDFPNEFTIITPNMIENYTKYGYTIYFGLYPEYVAQSKKLILCGGFYGINEHHIFVPFATVILTLYKREESVIIFKNLYQMMEKQDDDITKIIMSILRTFFNYYSNKVSTRDILLVIRQTNNTQAAIYQIRKEFPYMNFIYCFKEKLLNLEIEVNKRYCHDSYSCEEKLDFITALYGMVKTLQQEEYNTYLKNLFKKANTNNTLLLQKITEDSHLFCFCKTKDPSNNLYEQCIDQYFKKRYLPLIDTADNKSQQKFMRTIMNVINNVVTEQKRQIQQKTKILENTKIFPSSSVKADSHSHNNNEKVQIKHISQQMFRFSGCQHCIANKTRGNFQFFNETEMFETRLPELKNLKVKVCIKTYHMIIKQLVKCLKIKSYRVMKDYRQTEYFVFKNGAKYRIVSDESNLLSCDCLISKKYSIPCCHELFICMSQGISIERQLYKWMLQSDVQQVLQ